MKIPKKFICNEFADFIHNINDLGRDTRPISGYGSIQEWADHYQLLTNQGIDLNAILKLFKDTGCAVINEEANNIQYYHQQLIDLESFVRSQI